MGKLGGGSRCVGTLGGFSEGSAEGAFNDGIPSTGLCISSNTSYAVGSQPLNHEDVVNAAKLGTFPRYICGLWV